MAAMPLMLLGGCGRASQTDGGAVTAARLVRRGDEIAIAGQFFHARAPVVLWLDPGGYDAYRTDPHFPDDESAEGRDRSRASSKPAGPRFDLRADGLSDEEIARVRAGGWDLPLLQRVVDLFVIHYDACGVSRECFRVLHDQRGLSVHFMIDLDGTIYQTLDVKERAWHAGLVNGRSVGVEIANRGAYQAGQGDLDRWYARDEAGTRVALPAKLGDGGVRTPGFVARPDRAEPITGRIGEQALTMYDFTPQQYESLIRLTATLCTALPRIRCDYPADANGEVAARSLTAEELAEFRGLAGHFHVAEPGRKVDPGPAFQWQRVVREARKLMGRTPSEHWENGRSEPGGPRPREP
jgi:N-acetyl-anhydromuramyl-L-alanine amidase AmpD